MASQIKLLLEIPERIWSAMEASHYLQATQLYLLCCHLHSLLQLEATSGGLYSPVLARFPILVRQVATTGHFRYYTLFRLFRLFLCKNSFSLYRETLALEHKEKINLKEITKRILLGH